MGSHLARRMLAGLRGAVCGAALFATGASAPAADVPRFAAPAPFGFPAAPPPAVTLVFYDLQNQLPGGFASMSAEVRSIFFEIGVEVALRKAGPGDSYGSEPGREIAVIALAEDPSAARRGRQVLGLVVRDQQPTRALWVFIGNVRRALGIDVRAGFEPSGPEGLLLARALGRVVAHEVVHALAPDHPHDGAGLMKDSLSRGLLLGSRRPLGAVCARSVRAALNRPSWLARQAAGSTGPSIGIP